VRVPGAGGWGGDLVSAKAAGDRFRRDVTTNAIAENLNAWKRCIAGRQPSGSRSAAPARQDAGNMPRQNGSDGSRRSLGRTCRRKAKPQRPLPPGLRVVTQQKNILKFFAIGQDVTSPCENLPARLPRTAATTAAQQ